MGMGSHATNPSVYAKSSSSLVVLATRSITSHVIGQCLQRVGENYYANTSTTAFHTSAARYAVAQKKTCQFTDDEFDKS